MKELKATQDKFVREDLWLLTYSASFQRAHVYNKNQPVSQKKKIAFRNSMFHFCNSLAEEQYQHEVLENKHIENIQALVDFTASEFPELLYNGKLKFGVAQKLLNLYLKYLWCISDIPAPPHFPIDRIIQDLLKLPKRVSWTQMDSAEEYMMVINQAKKVMETKGYKSLAELELVEYRRKTLAGMHKK